MSTDNTPAAPQGVASDDEIEQFIYERCRRFLPSDTIPAIRELAATLAQAGQAVPADEVRWETSMASEQTSPHSTWDATVYKGEPDVTKCATCNKRGLHMKMISRGDIECSHVECPNRKRFTAAPMPRGGVKDE